MPMASSSDLRSRLTEGNTNPLRLQKRSLQNVRPLHQYSHDNDQDHHVVTDSRAHPQLAVSPRSRGTFVDG